MARRPSIPSTGAADVATLNATVQALQAQLAALTPAAPTPVAPVATPVTGLTFSLSASPKAAKTGGLKKSPNESWGDFYKRRVAAAPGSIGAKPENYSVARGIAVSIAAARLGDKVDPFNEKGQLWKGIHAFLYQAAGFLPYYTNTPVPVTQAELDAAKVRLAARRAAAK